MLCHVSWAWHAAQAHEAGHLIYHHATKAGCLTSFVTEQTAAKLLLDEFTPQQCRTMFPRYITVNLAERSRTLEAAFKSARDLPPPQKEAELRRLNVEVQQLLNAARPL